jgi:hypothetical protein
MCPELGWNPITTSWTGSYGKKDVDALKVVTQAPFVAYMIAKTEVASAVIALGAMFVSILSLLFSITRIRTIR